MRFIKVRWVRWSLLNIASMVVSCSAIADSDVVSHRELGKFLTDAKPNFGVFESNAKIKSIELRSDSLDRDLKYRVTTVRCSVDVTFHESQKRTLESVNCGGEDHSGDLKAALSTAVNNREFASILVDAFRKDILSKGDILALSVDEISRRLKQDGGLSPEEAIEWADSALTIFFTTGHGVSGGFVENGVIDHGLMTLIIEAEPYRIVSKVYELLRTLREDQ